MSGKKVLGVGLATVDQLIVWDDVRESVLKCEVHDLQLQGGGMVGTGLVAVARLGGKAEIWTVVGTDPVGDIILDMLERDGLDTRMARRAGGARSPIVLVNVDRPTGDRFFRFSPNWPGPGQPIGDLERLGEVGCVLVDGFLPDTALPAAREAQKRGIPVVADFSAGFGGRKAEIIQHVDHAIMDHRAADGEDDASLLRACRRIRDMGPPHVAITLGARGLASLHEDRFVRMAAFDVDVLDTTGAGDVFHGAFCYGLTEGFDLRRNLVFSSAVAALKCRVVGGRAGIPGRETVERFLEERGAPETLDSRRCGT